MYIFGFKWSVVVLLCLGLTSHICRSEWCLGPQKLLVGSRFNTTVPRRAVTAVCADGSVAVVSVPVGQSVHRPVPLWNSYSENGSLPLLSHAVPGTFATLNSESSTVAIRTLGDGVQSVQNMSALASIDLSTDIYLILSGCTQVSSPLFAAIGGVYLLFTTIGSGTACPLGSILWSTESLSFNAINLPTALLPVAPGTALDIQGLYLLFGVVAAQSNTASVAWYNYWAGTAPSAPLPINGLSSPVLDIQDAVLIDDSTPSFAMVANGWLVLFGGVSMSSVVVVGPNGAVPVQPPVFLLGAPSSTTGSSIAVISNVSLLIYATPATWTHIDQYLLYASYDFTDSGTFRWTRQWARQAGCSVPQSAGLSVMQVQLLDASWAAVMYIELGVWSDQSTNTAHSCSVVLAVDAYSGEVVWATMVASGAADSLVSCEGCVSLDPQRRAIAVGVSTAATNSSIRILGAATGEVLSTVHLNGSITAWQTSNKSEVGEGFAAEAVVCAGTTTGDYFVLEWSSIQMPDRFNPVPFTTMPQSIFAEYSTTAARQRPASVKGSKRLLLQSSSSGDVTQDTLLSVTSTTPSYSSLWSLVHPIPPTDNNNVTFATQAMFSPSAQSLVVFDVIQGPGQPIAEYSVESMNASIMMSEFIASLDLAVVVLKLPNGSLAVQALAVSLRLQLLWSTLVISPTLCLVDAAVVDALSLTAHSILLSVANTSSNCTWYAASTTLLLSDEDVGYCSTGTIRLRTSDGAVLYNSVPSDGSNAAARRGAVTSPRLRAGSLGSLFEVLWWPSNGSFAVLGLTGLLLWDHTPLYALAPCVIGRSPASPFLHLVHGVVICGAAVTEMRWLNNGSQAWMASVAAAPINRNFLPTELPLDAPFCPTESMLCDQDGSEAAAFLAVQTTQSFFQTASSAVVWLWGTTQFSSTELGPWFYYCQGYSTSQATPTFVSWLDSNTGNAVVTWYASDTIQIINISNTTPQTYMHIRDAEEGGGSFSDAGRPPFAVVAGYENVYIYGHWLYIGTSNGYATQYAQVMYMPRFVCAFSRGTSSYAVWYMAAEHRWLLEVNQVLSGTWTTRYNPTKIAGTVTSPYEALIVYADSGPGLFSGPSVYEIAESYGVPSIMAYADIPLSGSGAVVVDDSVLIALACSGSTTALCLMRFNLVIPLTYSDPSFQPMWSQSTVIAQVTGGTGSSYRLGISLGPTMNYFVFDANYWLSLDITQGNSQGSGTLTGTYWNTAWARRGTSVAQLSNRIAVTFVTLNSVPQVVAFATDAVVAPQMWITPLDPEATGDTFGLVVLPGAERLCVGYTIESTQNTAACSLCLDASNGTIMSQLAIVEAVLSSSPQWFGLAFAHLLIMHHCGGTLIAAELEDISRVVWTVLMPTQSQHIVNVTVGNGTAYVLTNDGVIHAFDAYTGQRLLPPVQLRINGNVPSNSGAVPRSTAFLFWDTLYVTINYDNGPAAILTIMLNLTQPPLTFLDTGFPFVKDAVLQDGHLWFIGDGSQYNIARLRLTATVIVNAQDVLLSFAPLRVPRDWTLSVALVSWSHVLLLYGGLAIDFETPSYYPEECGPTASRCLPYFSGPLSLHLLNDAALTALRLSANNITGPRDFFETLPPALVELRLHAALRWFQQPIEWAEHTAPIVDLRQLANRSSNLATLNISANGLEGVVLLPAVDGGRFVDLRDNNFFAVVSPTCEPTLRDNILLDTGVPCVTPSGILPVPSGQYCAPQNAFVAVVALDAIVLFPPGSRSCTYHLASPPAFHWNNLTAVNSSGWLGAWQYCLVGYPAANATRVIINPLFGNRERPWILLRGSGGVLLELRPCQTTENALATMLLRLDNCPSAWDAQRPVSTWPGVRETDAGYSVDISGYHLGGTLDFKLLGAGFPLIAFNASRNNLTGSLELSALPSRVTMLDLSRNRLTGSIDMSPFETDEMLSGPEATVMTLVLYSNLFSGLVDLTRVAPGQVAAMTLGPNPFLEGVVMETCGSTPPDNNGLRCFPAASGPQLPPLTYCGYTSQLASVTLYSVPRRGIVVDTAVGGHCETGFDVFLSDINGLLCPATLASVVAMLSPCFNSTILSVSVTLNNTIQLSFVSGPALELSPDQCSAVPLGSYCAVPMTRNMSYPGFFNMVQVTLQLSVLAGESVALTFSSPMMPLPLITTCTVRSNLALNASLLIGVDAYRDTLTPCLSQWANNAAAALFNAGAYDRSSGTLVLQFSGGNSLSLTSASCRPAVSPDAELCSVPWNTSSIDTLTASRTCVLPGVCDANSVTEWQSCGGGASSLGFAPRSSCVAFATLTGARLRSVTQPPEECSMCSALTTTQAIDGLGAVANSSVVSPAQLHEICRRLSAALGQYGWCATQHGVAAPFASDAFLQQSATCSLCRGVSTDPFIHPCRMLDYFADPGLRVSFSCVDGGISGSLVAVSPCNSSQALFTAPAAGACGGSSLALTCSPCRPLIAAGVITQPYLFIVIGAFISMAVSIFVTLYVKPVAGPLLHATRLNVLMRFMPYDEQEKQAWRERLLQRLARNIVTAAELIGQCNDLLARVAQGTSTVRVRRIGEADTDSAGLSVTTPQQQQPMDETSTDPSWLSKFDFGDGPTFQDYYYSNVTNNGRRAIANVDSEGISHRFGALLDAWTAHQRRLNHVALRRREAQRNSRVQRWLGGAAAAPAVPPSVASELYSDRGEPPGADVDHHQTPRSATDIVANPSNAALQQASVVGRREEESLSRALLSSNDDDSSLLSTKESLDAAMRRFVAVCDFTPVILTHYATDVLSTPPYWLIALTVLYNVAFLALLIVDAVVRYPTTYSAWSRYTVVYMQYVNSTSGIGSVLNSVLRDYYIGESGLRRPSPLTWVALLLIAPGAVTHIAPGAVLYSWIVGPVLAVVAGLFALFRKSFIKGSVVRPSSGAVALRLFLRLVLVVTVTVAAQSSFNWAALMYNAPPVSALEYLNIVEREFDSRGSVCFVWAKERSLASGMQFFSFLAI